MTQHDHREFVPGCYRCDLGREEVFALVAAERNDHEQSAEYWKAMHDHQVELKRRLAAHVRGLRAALRDLSEHHDEWSDGTTSGWWRASIRDLLADPLLGQSGDNAS